MKIAVILTFDVPDNTNPEDVLDFTRGAVAGKEFPMHVLSDYIEDSSDEDFDIPKVELG